MQPKNDSRFFLCLCLTSASILNAGCAFKKSLSTPEGVNENSTTASAAGKAIHDNPSGKVTCPLRTTSVSVYLRAEASATAPIRNVLLAGRDIFVQEIQSQTCGGGSFQWVKTATVAGEGFMCGKFLACNDPNVLRPCPDNEKEMCGNFSAQPDLVNLCIQHEGSEEVCKGHRWNRKFYDALLRLQTGITSTSPTDAAGSTKAGAHNVGATNPEDSEAYFNSTTQFAVVALKAAVLLRKPTDLDTSAFLALPHTRSLAPQNALSEVEGRRLFFLGMYAQANNKESFNSAQRHGLIDPIAPCAQATSSVLEEAARKASLTQVTQIFANHAGDFSPTHNVEIAMRMLGFQYYLKQKYRAPRGAIGMLAGRGPFHGTPAHSYHIYTIYEDKGVGQLDLINDDGGFAHIYEGPGAAAGTEGFWLPPGVYPIKR